MLALSKKYIIDRKQLNFGQKRLLPQVGSMSNGNNRLSFCL